MANFLLVHGASHGAWCWDRIVPRLQAAGHTVRAIDLPSHGDDPTPPAKVTMTDYVAAVLGAMSDDTIFVGHSLGGLPITLAAASAPERTRALVYLCALLPRQGLAFRDFRDEAISPTVDETALPDRDAGVSRVIPEKAADVFYHDCGKEDQDFALARLSPQPIAVMTEPLDFDPPDTPRHYIRCLDDRVVLPDYQRATSADWPNVHDMTCGHSPFLSDPDELTAILDRIAEGA